ncbi:MAG: hypothetical protein WEA24_15040 [Gemmatimonadota bacterium]
MALAACNDHAVTGNEPVRPASLQVEEEIQRRPGEWLLWEMASRIPDFSGVHRGAEGEMVVTIRRGSDPAGVLSTLNSLLTEARSGTQGTDFRQDRTTILEVDYSFTELAAWRDVITGPTLQTGQVAMIDLDERANRLVVYVYDGSAMPTLQAIATAEGVPGDAVEVEVTSRIRDMADLTDQFSEMTGGIQVYNTTVANPCTLGFTGWWKDIDADPEEDLQRVVVVNSHCTKVRGGGSDGSTQYQDSTPRDIGIEVEDPAFFSDTGDPACASPKRCRYSDAAVIALDGSIDWDFGTIARTQSNGQWTGSTTISTQTPSFTVTGNADIIMQGDTLHKMGRTTGWTTGDVDKTCVDIQAPNTNITYLCQHEVTAGVGNSDSGSPVFSWPDDQESEVLLHGILWAGLDDGQNSYYIFSPIGGIEFDVDPIQTWN